MIIPLERIGVSLPLSSKDPRLIFQVIILKKSQLYDQGKPMSQTEGQMDDLP